MERAVGAGLLALLAVSLLFFVHDLWLPRRAGVLSDGVTSDRVTHLDLAQAARFARRRPASGPLAPTHRDTQISLPPGSEIAWTLRLPARAELHIGAVRMPAGRRAELHVETADERGAAAPARLQELESCAPCRIDLSRDAERITRIGLRAAPREGGEAGAIEIVDARILGASEATVSTPGADAARPSVVLYLIDTLRPDKLGAYGNPQGLTPEIDAFAREATTFEYAVAQAPWTKPSVASIFTGLYARVHRIVTFAGVMPQEATTIAELLRDDGYATAAVVTNGLVDADFGFDQGFDRFVREHGAAPDVPGITGFRADKPAIDSHVAGAAAGRLLDEIGSERPFFLYVHVLDPHTPHFPPEPYKSRFAADVDRVELGSMESVRTMDESSKAGHPPDAETRAQLERLYDAEIAHNDHQFGVFMDELRRRGVYDDALVILVSDHGEAFWEHGYRGHGKDLHEELLRVPLIVKRPGQTTPQRVAGVAQHVDLMPTLLDYAGLPSPPSLNGRSLRPFLEDAEEASHSAGPLPRIAVSNDQSGTAIREGRWKVVKHADVKRPLELYDLETDPGETRNLAAAHPLVTRYLLETVARLEAASKPSKPPAERALTPAKRAELKALGYID